VQVIVQTDDDTPPTVHEVARVERAQLRIHTLGLHLAEAKDLLQKVQDVVIAEQARQALKAKVREKVGEFFRGLTNRSDEVKRRCRTILQTQADNYTTAVHAILQPATHVDPTLALV
jgi:hypothetical protein